jgi:hypothetical protein
VWLPLNEEEPFNTHDVTIRDLGVATCELIVYPNLNSKQR